MCLLKTTAKYVYSGISIGIMAMSQVACTSVPKISPENSVVSGIASLAPFIVVGTITSNSDLHRPIKITDENAPQVMPSDSEVVYHLFRVNVRIENVLRGSIRQSNIAVYYYTQIGPLGGTPRLGMWNTGGLWHIGDREIFYLKKSAGVFRTYCDIVAPCATPVFSGAHPGFTIDPSRPPAESIIDLLLTRGRGSTDQGMVKAVLSRSAEYFNEPYTIRKWQEIAEHDESAAVRDAACSQLKKEELPCPSYRGTSARKQGS